MLQLTSKCWVETVLVSIKLMLWCRFGLQEMMCGWFTTLKLLGKELCLGEGLSPNALSSCLLLFWSSWLLLLGLPDQLVHMRLQSLVGYACHCCQLESIWVEMSTLDRSNGSQPFG